MNCTEVINSIYYDRRKNTRVSVDKYSIIRSLDNSVSIVIWLQAGRPGFYSLHGQRTFLFATAFRRNTGAHTASCSMGSRGCFPVGKAAGAWSWPLFTIWCRG